MMQMRKRKENKRQFSFFSIDEAYMRRIKIFKFGKGFEIIKLFLFTYEIITSSKLIIQKYILFLFIYSILSQNEDSKIQYKTNLNSK